MRAVGRGGEHNRCAARAPCGSDEFTARPITCTCGRSVSLLGSRLSTSRSMLRIFCSGPCTQRGHGRSARRLHPSTRASSRVGACLCELRLPFGEKRGERREEVPQKVAARRREPVSAAQGSAGHVVFGARCSPVLARVHNLNAVPHLRHEREPLRDRQVGVDQFSSMRIEVAGDEHGPSQQRLSNAASVACTPPPRTRRSRRAIVVGCDFLPHVIWARRDGAGGVNPGTNAACQQDARI